jgi:two-component system cell cycle sensor histidine kinase/response regulator CckA
MTVSIGILLAGASDATAESIIETLRQAGYDPMVTRAHDGDSYLAALDRGSQDAMIFDAAMPRFCADAALSEVKGRGLDVPFIVISHATDEEQIVGLLKAGAHDVVSAARLERLPFVLMGELEDAKDRRERRQTDEALRRSEDLFRQSQKMDAIGQLAGGVAHDFNNLLTAILGYTALLLESARDQPDMMTDLREIQKAGERAGSLTRQLLTFSRKQALQPVTLNLNDVLAELEKMLRRLVGDDIRFETIKEPALHHIKVDPNQIEQILMNLAVNARDAMPHGGLVTIQTKNETMPADPRDPTNAASWPCVTLTVSDTGTGIPPEILDRIFEPFFTTKGPGKGTGLGLSTVYGVVTQSGGAINVESKPKKGTSFSIQFPAIDIPVEVVGPNARQRAGHTVSETILLVEDEPGVRHLVQRVLTGRGYAVLEARDVAHAAAIATDHPGPIHLLLTDIVMPGLSGPDLAQRVVAQRPDVRVLYMSGFANRLNTHHGSLSSGVTILRKPFTPEHLVRTVRDCLDVTVS